MVVGWYSRTKAIATQHVLDAAKEGLNACVVHPSGIEEVTLKEMCQMLDKELHCGTCKAYLPLGLAQKLAKMMEKKAAHGSRKTGIITELVNVSYCFLPHKNISLYL